MPRYFSRVVLMLGNVVTGLTILGPAGMLAELADGLHVGIHDTGLLVTYGAVVLFIGSPVMAWLTTRIDRRALLVATLAIMAAGEAASALAPDYNLNLSLRLVVLAFAAIYTPQAAATVALIVTDRERASAIAFVFLGWSVAIAGGLPLVTLIATHFGWQAVYGVLAVLAATSLFCCSRSCRKGSKGRPLSPQSYVTIGCNKRIVLILLVTLLQTSGQFTVFIYLAPLLKALTGAGAAVASAYFAFYGVVGLLGNVVASAIVTALGTQKDSCAVHGLDAFRPRRMGRGRRLVACDGSRGVLLGVWLFSDQLDAAGPARCGSARSCKRFGRAQHVRALRWAGGRLRHWRAFVCARVLPRRRLCWRSFRGIRLCRPCGDVGIRQDALASSREMRRSFLFVSPRISRGLARIVFRTHEFAERQSDAKQRGA